MDLMAYILWFLLMSNELIAKGWSYDPWSGVWTPPPAASNVTPAREVIKSPLIEQ